MLWVAFVVYPLFLQRNDGKDTAKKQNLAVSTLLSSFSNKISIISNDGKVNLVSKAHFLYISIFHSKERMEIICWEINHIFLITKFIVSNLNIFVKK